MRSRQLIRERGLSADVGIQQALDEVAEGSATTIDEEALRQAVRQELSGFGVLQPYLNDPNIEEIWLNRPDELNLFGSQGLRRVELDLSETALREIVYRMLKHSNRRLDRLTPYVDADLPDGSRLHVVIPQVTRRYWAVNIRKFSSARFSIDALVTSGTLMPEQADFLRAAVRNRKTILVSGATQAGKTTLLSALLREVSEQERIVSCEDTFELSLANSDWVAMQTRPASPEGDNEIGLRELVRQALRMRPDWLVIGEVRGAEALDLLVALNSGIPGMCTLHAKSARGALDKLMTLPLLAGENITEKFLRPTILGAVDLIAHCERDRGGSRRVAEILEVGHEAVD
ncbi:MAG: ATPase, T2SS/T4P/T4SS family [Aquiluna sp.]